MFYGFISYLSFLFSAKETVRGINKNINKRYKVSPLAKLQFLEMKNRGEKPLGEGKTIGKEVDVNCEQVEGG